MPNNANSSLKKWVQAVRVFSFTASLIPCLLGAMLALLFAKGPQLWYLLPFIIISSVCLQAATNLIGDYYDYKKGADTTDSLGGSRVLVDNLLQPKQLFNGGLFFFFLAVIFGLPIILARGEIILALGLIGIVMGFCYTGWPIGYKYYGLGDFFVFILMGPLMVVGTFFSLTGNYTPTILYASLPIGFLVTGILQANNLR